MTANSVVTRFSNQRVLYSRKVSTAQNPRFKALVHQTAFPCTNPRLKAVGTPESLFLHQLHDSMQLVHQKAFSYTKPTIQGVGTPDGLSLYQLHDSMQLVHQKAFSCTKPTIQCSWYTRKPFPVPNPRFNALVHQMAFPCTNSMIQCSWYTRKPFPVPTPIIKLSKR